MLGSSLIGSFVAEVSSNRAWAAHGRAPVLVPASASCPRARNTVKPAERELSQSSMVDFPIPGSPSRTTPIPPSERTRPKGSRRRRCSCSRPNNLVIAATYRTHFQRGLPISKARRAAGDAGEGRQALMTCCTRTSCGSVGNSSTNCSTKHTPALGTESWGSNRS